MAASSPEGHGGAKGTKGVRQGRKHCDVKVRRVSGGACKEERGIHRCVLGLEKENCLI